MLKARMLVCKPLTYPEWIKYIRNISVLVVEQCLSPSIWLGWTKFKAIDCFVICHWWHFQLIFLSYLTG